MQVRQTLVVFPEEAAPELLLSPHAIPGIGVLQERYADQMQEGKYEDALATLGALRALQPRSPRVAEWEGMTCFSLERWIDAIVAFRRALELGSSDPVVRQMLCEALCKEARKRLSDDDGEGGGRNRRRNRLRNQV